MSKGIVYITFIPWFLYFFSLCKSALKDLQTYPISLKWFKKNILRVFHFENIILFSIFIYFSTYYSKSNQIWLVEILLFSAINLYLFINRYYDKNRSNVVFSTKDLSTILLIILLILIPIVFYIGTSNYVITYYILFGYSFFNYLIVFIAKTINDLILKLIARKNHEE